MDEPRQECKCMQLTIRLFRSVGSWPHWSRSHTWQERMYFGYSFVMVTLFFIYVLIQLYGLSVYYYTWKSLDAAIEDVIVVVTGAIAFLKMVIIVWNQKKLQELIDYINRDLMRHICCDEDFQIVQSCIRHERKLTKIYLAFPYCITFLYTASSIVKIIKFRSATEYHDTLPLKYPFRIEKFPMYHIAYVHQFIVMILNGQVGVLVDSCFSCLVHYICAHFHVVSNRIKRHGGAIEKDSVGYHLEVMRLIDRVQSIFSSLLSFQFSSNSLLICLAVFQVTQIAEIKPIHYVKCLIYLTIKLMQLFLYCWYGEEVIQRSLEIGNASYSTKWYEPKNKKYLANLRFIIRRAQKPVQMSAGYFTVSLATFKAVLNTAYQCFTILKILDG